MGPKGDSATTYGGVLTRPAAVVVATLVAIGAVALVGWKARDVVDKAEAAVAPASLETAALESLRKDIGEVKGDLVKIKCRLNIDGMCPPESTVRASSMSGR